MNVIARSSSRQLDEENDEEKLQDSWRKEIVRTVFIYCASMAIVSSTIKTVALYVGGSDIGVQRVGTTFFFICTTVSTRFGYSYVSALSCILVFVCLNILYETLTRGCSSTLFPAIYGIMPCLFGFLYQTKRAVLLSAAGVICLIFVLFAAEVSGNCVSENCQQAEVGVIVADRLLPLLCLTLINCVAILKLLEHSKASIRRHVAAARAAAKLAKMRQDTLRRLAHELRTPLNGMVGSVDLLTSSCDMTDYDMENVCTTDSCLKHMIQICDDILLAAKSENPNQTHKKTVFQLTSCVDAVVDTFASAAAAKGIKLMVEFAGNTTSLVRGMNVEIRQVLMNLVGNAVKFTNSGSVTIRVSEDAQLSSTEFLHYLFEVEDTGIGVSSENCSMLFEAFYQEEQDAVSRQHKGTGLGLTICQNLVKTMGGEIAIESQLGRGSRFFFSLALKRESEGSHSPSASDTKRLPHKPDPDIAPRVLIADNDNASGTCCESLVKSVAPSAVISRVQSHSALMDLISEEDRGASSDSRSHHHIIFMGCADELATDSLVSTLRKLKSDGWYVFAYTDHDSFEHLVRNGAKHASRVFRRPLPLVRMEAKFHQVLVSGSLKPPPGTRDTVDESSWEQVIVEATREEETPPFTSSQREEDSESSSPAGAGRAHASLPSSVSENATPPIISPPSASRPRVARQDVIELPSGSKVLVVDDTPTNVKVLERILSRTLSSSVPIVPYGRGQEAIDAVASSKEGEHLLILMDWHMPGICGLSATAKICQLVQERGKNSPSVRICMVSADSESICEEMDKRGITWLGEVSNGELQLRDGIGTRESDDVASLIPEVNEEMAHPATVDLLASKPVTIKSVKAILAWFSTVIG